MGHANYPHLPKPCNSKLLYKICPGHTTWSRWLQQRLSFTSVTQPLSKMPVPTLLEITGSNQDLMHWGTELLPTQLQRPAQNPQIFKPSSPKRDGCRHPLLAAGSHAFISTGVAKHHSRAGADKGSAGKAPRRGWRCQAHAMGAQGTPPDNRWSQRRAPAAGADNPRGGEHAARSSQHPGVCPKESWAGRERGLGARKAQQLLQGFIPAFGLPQAPLNTRQVSCVPHPWGRPSPDVNASPVLINSFQTRAGNFSRQSRLFILLRTN